MLMCLFYLIFVVILLFLCAPNTVSPWVTTVRTEDSAGQDLSSLSRFSNCIKITQKHVKMQVLWSWIRPTNSESLETGCENRDFYHRPSMRKADENKSYHTWAGLFTVSVSNAKVCKVYVTIYLIYTKTTWKDWIIKSYWSDHHTSLGYWKEIVRLCMEAKCLEWCLVPSKYSRN